MMKSKLFFSFLGCIVLANSIQAQEPVDYVDPLIGSSAHGHVFVGASRPFGAVQLGPDNISKGWDWCSGYHYSDSVLVGFSHTHLSGTGIGDLGDILFSPYTGNVKTAPGTQDNITSGYGSHYSHEGEEVAPGYYRVQLEDYRIRVELTSSDRVGLHKYIFPAGQESHITIDLQYGLNWDKPVETYIKQLDDYTLVGYRFSKGWAPDQRLWFAIKSSQPIKDMQLFDSSANVGGTELKSTKSKAVLSLGSKGGTFMYKVGLSPVSYQGALNNIAQEIPGWDFEKVKADARSAWNKSLKTINYSTPDAKKKTVFYTAMYHSMIQPSLFNDVDRSYRGTDKKVYEKAAFDNYSVFSLWDTYRTLHPLMTIIQPQRESDFINSLLAIDQQQGFMPIWPLMGGETYCMIGYPAIPVIADAILKGFTGFDVNQAYEGMKRTANQDTLGIEYVKKLGYIPADKEPESVAKAMEYAISDYSIAKVAEKLGKTDDYSFYLKRSKLYQQYFDKSVGFVRGRMSDGTWRSPFSPFEAKHRDNDYTEGNAWQYTWLAPQDPHGLIGLFGSDAVFVNKLDSLFSAQGSLGPEASPDISGLIGMYAQGNEPNHHTPYLYAYAGQQWKTAEKVRQIGREFFTDAPDGLCGNDDCGQMSAWYVMSALGFYPVNVADGNFVFGSPSMSKATVKTGNKAFTVIAENNNDKNIYIQAVFLNGKPYTKSYISYKDIMAGGTLKFVMGATPNKQFGVGVGERP
ncbi:MAG: GH92 family glycosyl hydrolase [Chitinophagaceae bacterium]